MNCQTGLASLRMDGLDLSVKYLRAEAKNADDESYPELAPGFRVRASFIARRYFLAFLQVLLQDYPGMWESTLYLLWYGRAQTGIKPPPKNRPCDPQECRSLSFMVKK